MKIVANNKKAYFNYEILEDFEAGLVLFGDEAKSLRGGACSLKEAYARIERTTMEAFLVGMTIDRYKFSTHTEIDPIRKRKLLLHKNEIRRILKKLDEKGFTLVPLSVYFNDRNIAKVKLGLAKGKKIFDKRETIKRRDFEREQGRERKSSI